MRTVRRPPSRTGSGVAVGVVVVASMGALTASVLVTAAAALAAGAERVAAAAGRRRVRALDGEDTAHEVLLVVDLGPLQVAQAHGVDDDLDAVLLEDLVLVGGLVQHHAVAEAGAAAPL